MKAITELREAVALLLTDKATPKDALAALAGHEAQPGVETATADLKALPWNAKAKAEGILRDLLAKLDEEEEGEASAIARLPEIELTISELMKTSATSLLSVGQLLNEAREEFENSKDFLAWSKDKFGFAKAYTYRLMAVADEFGQDEVFSGCAISVLNRVARMPEEVKADAREAAAAGTLTAGKVREIEQKHAPEPVNEPSGEAQGGEEGESTGVDYEGSEAPAWKPETVERVAPVQHVQAPEQSEEVKQLRELVSELQAELAATKQEREAKGKAKATSLPMLPQFSSKCFYARLGLSADEGNSAQHVNKAFRAFVKAGYNSSHEAYAKLLEAKDELLAGKDGNAEAA